MLEAIRQNLTMVISEVLETMFFVFLEPQPGACPQSTDFVGAQVVISSPDSSFEIELLAQSRLLEVIAADFLGLEEGLVTADQSQDVLKEITNMVVGNLVNICDPEAQYKLGIPSVLGVSLAGSRLSDCVDKYVYGADDGVFLVGIRSLLKA
ncbi:chemotaxis protein CheX [bacterium]|nr:chemotaxis protein CheX [bacterium]